MQINSSASFLKKHLPKIFLFGLPVLYFLIAVSFFLYTYDSAQIKITLLHLGGLFLILTWLAYRVEEGNFTFLKDNFIFILPILLFLFSGVLSYFTSSFQLASFNELIKRIIYCGLALIIISEFNSDKKISRIMNWLIAATYIVTIYGTIQLFDHLLFPPPPGSGLDPFTWRQAFGDRIFSTFGNPNFFGDFLIVMNPIVMALYMQKRKFYLMFLWVMIAFCTIFTFSKGAWLGYTAGIFVFIVMYLLVFMKQYLNKKTVISASITAIVIIAIAMFGIFTFSKKRPDSISFRLFTWLSTWEMINTNPVFGTGMGSFYVTYPSWRRPQIFFIEGKHNTESDHPENEYLEVWFDEGIIGITLFLLLIVFVFKAGYKNMNFLHNGKGARGDPMAYIQLGIFSAFAAQLVHDSVCVSLRFVSSGVMLWMLIGVTIVISVICFGRKREEYKDYLSRPLKTVIQVLLVLIIGYAMYYMAGYFKADYVHSKAIQHSKKGEWAQALEKYDEVIKANKSFPMPFYFKINVYLDRWASGDPILVQKTFEGLWKLAPNYVQSKYLAGIMYTKLLEDAVNLRNEYAKEGRPEDDITKQNRQIEEFFKEALRNYNEYIMIDPIFPLTYYKAASLYAGAGDYQKAEEVLKEHLSYPEQLSKHPHDFWVEDWRSRRKMDYSETYTQLGNLFVVQNKPEEARENYLKALELIPQNLTARKNLSVVYNQLGEPEKSRQQWIEIYRINPNDEDAKRYLQNLGLLQ